jgi:alanine racemase
VRPISASVSLRAFRHNLARARQAAGAGVHVQAVVKANAYGHGLARIYPALDEADGLAVIELENAVLLREQLGWQREITVLEGFYTPAELDVFAAHRISAVVHCNEQIAMLEGTTLPQPIKVYLKINSGMNRLGLPLHAARAAHARVAAMANVREVVLMTHFAQADEADGLAAPLRAYRQATDGLACTHSLANSAATLRMAEVGGQYVRPGIMLYGSAPLVGYSATELALEPVMTLATQIIGIQQLVTGDAVGYGATFRAPSPRRIAVIACGYADGYPRHAPTGTPVWVEATRAPVVGRISMDKITIDITDVPAAQIGSTVELWGQQIPVDEVAHYAGTISYELLTAVTARVPFHVHE